jgi:hypothetical protein
MDFSGPQIRKATGTAVGYRTMDYPPSLTPEKAKELILVGATPSDDGKRKLIDEKRTPELVKEKKATS